MMRSTCAARGESKSGEMNTGLRVLRIGCLAAVIMTAAAPSLAQQKFPVKPIRLVCAFTPGGTTDILARLITPGMSEAWGHPIVIEARPGAGGTLAAALVAKATPDGYTLLATSAAIVIATASSSTLPYDLLKDFAPVAELGYSTTLAVISPGLGIRSLKEFIAMAQSRAKPVLFGSTGALTSTHLSGERFRQAAGIKATHVGFKGQVEFLIEIAADRVHFGTPGMMAALPLIRDGKLIPLVVATPKRSPVLPDVPAAPEVLPGWGRDGSQAWFAPAGTPLAIRQQISREVARNLALPAVKEKLNNLGFEAAPTLPDEHAKNLRADLEIFTRLAQQSGLKPGK
ncbi:MAG: tripartite tricarboxylate transporter substrate binding protein [Betaproteobacteria bacterium]|nr:tripartite tricarboxylate transporter substrate binding protein [Betaproteobacteria bacterium]